MLPTIPSGGNEFEVAQATEQGPVLKTKTKKEKGLKYLFNGVSPQASPVNLHFVLENSRTVTFPQKL